MCVGCVGMCVGCVWDMCGMCRGVCGMCGEGMGVSGFTLTNFAVALSFEELLLALDQ